MWEHVRAIEQGREGKGGEERPHALQDLRDVFIYGILAIFC